jgi:hypothetical protein
MTIPYFYGNPCGDGILPHYRSRLSSNPILLFFVDLAIALSRYAGRQWLG